MISIYSLTTTIGKYSGESLQESLRRSFRVREESVEGEAIEEVKDLEQQTIEEPLFIDFGDTEHENLRERIKKAVEEGRSCQRVMNSSLRCMQRV